MFSSISFLLVWKLLTNYFEYELELYVISKINSKGDVDMRIIELNIIENYKKYLTEGEKSQATIGKYIRDITAFYEWINGRNIDKRAILEYKEHLISSYAPRSVNSILSSLNNLFDYLGWHDFKVKTLKIQKQIFAETDKELTKSEYMRLLQAAKNNKRLYYLMQTICSTGLRVSELKYISVEAVRTSQANIHCKGKMRMVILPKQLCKILKQYIKERNIKSGAIFVTKTGKPLDRSNIWSDMKKLCDSAGVARSKVFPHNLRHLFARTFYSLQKDIVRLADILGHSSVNTTRIYTMESGDVHRRQIERMNMLCRLTT